MQGGGAATQGQEALVSVRSSGVELLEEARWEGPCE